MKKLIKGNINNDLIIRIDPSYLIEELNFRVLLKEWAMWSKCFGQVIIITGVSSVGKTTLANYFSSKGFNKISYDDIYLEHVVNSFVSLIPNEILEAQQALIQNNDIKKIIFGHKINKNKYQQWQKFIIGDLENTIASVKSDVQFCDCKEVYEKMYDQAKIFIFSGRNVIIDDVISNSMEVNLFSYSFRYYPTSIILLYASLEENLKKCFLRNYLSIQDDTFDTRMPAHIIEQYFSFYKFVPSNEQANLSDRLLERVDKAKAKNILSWVVSKTYDVLYYLYGDTGHKSYHESLQKMYISIEKIKNSLMLYNNEDVFVATVMKYDYIINSNYSAGIAISDTDLIADLINILPDIHWEC